MLVKNRKIITNSRIAGALDRRYEATESETARYEVRGMSFSAITLAAVLLGSVPAGYCAARAARHLSESANPAIIAMMAACASLGTWAVLISPTSALLAISCGLAWVLLVLGAVDALAFRLPDILTLPLAGAGLAVAAWLPDSDLLGHAVGAVIAGLLFYAIAAGYQRVRHRDGLGFGDVKLAAAAGAWVGWQQLPYVVLFACAVGLVWAGIAAIRRGRSALEERIPFGVALCAGLWIVWLYGSPELFGPVF